MNATTKKIRQIIEQKPYLDWRTLAVISIMVAGFPVLGWLHYHEIINPWFAVILGSLLMNLSFTAWHEPSHQNLSKSASINTVAGWIASFASVYPGYFARRREHLIHHKWEGQEGMDPVYPRIQTDFWNFPKNLLLVNFSERSRLNVPDSFVPVTSAQRISDSVSNYLALGVVVLSVALNFWWTVWWVWILPRIIIFMFHAYWVCFFPHQVENGGYRVYRVRNGGWLLRFLTLEQNMHGVHHAWPGIPWHRYKDLFPLTPEIIAEKNIEIV